MGLVDNMLKLLDKEANDDKMKRDLCNTDLSKNADKKAQLENGIKTKSAELANLKDNLVVVNADIAGLTSSLAELDNSVKAATAQRKEENAAFSEMQTTNNQAVEI